MNETKEDIRISQLDFGEMQPYREDFNVTDISWNGRQLWVTDTHLGRYKSKIELSDGFIDTFKTKLGNIANAQCNATSPILETGSKYLRFTLIDENHTCSGTTLDIRKIPAVRRINRGESIAKGYATHEIFCLLENAILANCSTIISGTPGCGKTELIKYLIQFIPVWNRVLTIEDIFELHLSDISPELDSISLKVVKEDLRSRALDGSYSGRTGLTYPEALSVALRESPSWLVLQEARGNESEYLLECLSSMKGLSTVHTTSVDKIPRRFKNMCPSYMTEDEVFSSFFSFVDFGVQMGFYIDKSNVEQPVKRYIKQICFYNVDKNGENQTHMIVDNGVVISRELPEALLMRFAEFGIENPFQRRVIIER